jgi:SNF2 family DNA or RNA helicase
VRHSIAGRTALQNTGELPKDEAVTPELPPLYEHQVLLDLFPEHRKAYDELAAYYRQKFQLLAARPPGVESSPHDRAESSEAQGNGQPTEAGAILLEGLVRLRQLACHPALLDPERADEESVKLDLLLERLAVLEQSGRKALVFSQFTSLLALVRARLDRAKIRAEYLDGSTRDRSRPVELFQQDPSVRVLLVSLKAGGTGLNLTAADDVFILDPWWNPAVEAQAIHRAHRIGQTKPVFAWKLVAKGTVEQREIELQDKKRAIAQSLFDQALGGLSQEELLALL